MSQIFELARTARERRHQSRRADQDHLKYYPSRISRMNRYKACTGIFIYVYFLRVFLRDCSHLFTTIKKHFWEAVSAKRLLWSTLQHHLFKYVFHKEDLKGNACLSTVTQLYEATSFILLRRASFTNIHFYIGRIYRKRHLK